MKKFLLLITIALFSASSCKKDLPEHAYYCERCGGSGYKFFDDDIYGKCIACRGRGYFYYPFSSPYYNTLNGGEITFKGRHCTYTVGCKCSSFEPTTDGDVWEESICKKCKHPKSSHP